MNTREIDDALAEMSPEEIRGGLVIIDELELQGCISRLEAAQWRWRIMAWQQHVGLRDTAESA
jgi:hypothetical protein